MILTNKPLPVYNGSLETTYGSDKTCYTQGPMRTAKQVIDQAIQDNHVPEVLLYTFACIFVITGEILVGISVWHRTSLTMAILGVALNGLAWPAVILTRGLRQQNLMLRMLEVPLMKARTTDEAARMLTTAFGNHFLTESSKRLGLVKQA
jgi:hypothetical protein